MQERFMKVYYGIDRLPYKDETRLTHYPIASTTSGGNVLVGENNTTKIYFYVGQIGGMQRQWIANIKKPNGTLSYQLLTNATSEGIDYRVELDISSLYADQYGEVKIGLQGYDSNNVVITYDDENEVYEISGNPSVIATGTISILVNYAPSVLPKGETLSPSNEQLILGAYADKVDKTESFISVDAKPLNTSGYAQGQIVYSRADNKFYRAVGNEFVWEDIHFQSTDYVLKAGDTMQGDLNLGTHKLKSGNNVLVEATDILVVGDTNLPLNLKGAETYVEYNNKQLATKEAVDDNTSAISTINGKIPNDATATNKLSTKSYVDERDNILASRISQINAKIPNDASVQNQLATQSYVNGKITNVYVFKGSVATYNDLPTNVVITGWVYNVEDTGTNYASIYENGTLTWDALGGVSVDLSSYMKKDGSTAMEGDLNLDGYNIDDAYTISSLELKTEKIDMFGHISVEPSADTTRLLLKYDEIAYLQLDYDGITPSNYYATQNIGSSTSKFGNLYLSGTVYVGSSDFNFSQFDANTWIFKKGDTNIAFGDLNNTYINGLQPIDANRNLGASTDSRRWNDIYLHGKIDLGNSYGFKEKDDGDIVLDRAGTEVFNFGTGNGTAKIGYTFVPTANDTYSLGNSSYKFKDLYLSGKVYSYTIVSNGTLYLNEGGRATECAGELTTKGTMHLKNQNGTSSWKIKSQDNDLYIQRDDGSTLNVLLRSDEIWLRNTLPQTNNTYSLGNESQLWKDLYLSGKLTDGTNEITIAELVNGNSSSATPASSGTTWYKHTIKYYNSSSPQYMTIITNRSTQYNRPKTLRDDLSAVITDFNYGNSGQTPDTITKRSYGFVCVNRQGNDELKLMILNSSSYTIGTISLLDDCWSGSYLVSYTIEQL